jgi:hypothetical protein
VIEALLTVIRKMHETISIINLHGHKTQGCKAYEAAYLKAR